jgi:outer membrane immunogenic protein
VRALFIGSVAALALGASAALAADLPLAVKATPAPPLPAVNWTGCYVNGGGGYGMWNQDHFTETFPAPSVALSSTTTTGGRGWFGVVGGGCDYQFTALQHDFVVGVLADYDFMNLSGTFQDSAIGFGDTERERSAWAAGGRIGYLVTPSVLTYVNGGYTQSRFDQVNYSVLFIPPPAIPSGSSISANTYRGWFIGGGTELALEWFPGLFWRNEFDMRATAQPICRSRPVLFWHPALQFTRTSRCKRFRPSSSTSSIGRDSRVPRQRQISRSRLRPRRRPRRTGPAVTLPVVVATACGTTLHRNLAGSLHPNFIDRHDRGPRLVRYGRRRLRLSIQRAQGEHRGWRIRRL